MPPALLRLAPLAGVLLASSTLAAAPAPAAAPARPYGETPEKFTPPTGLLDHERRTVDIPMRDGVKLHTIILLPKGARGRPILLTRTPYDAEKMTSHTPSVHLGPVLAGYDHVTDVIVEGGYIRVVQDVRGKHGSEGDYVMNRPLRGPLNPTATDHATDTWDTIDWLVKNVPESNGRVGIIGISYDGFTPLMALVDPHPALKVSVPMNPMVDGWMGDDWFHHGAFRQTMAPYVYNQQASRKNDFEWPSTHGDEYEEYLAAGSAGALGRMWGLDQVGFWRKFVEHPAYDAFWQGQAMDRVLGARPLTVPTLVVHSLWDQEDIYGAPAVYAALAAKDPAHEKVFLVMGPWHHGQALRDGSKLGAIEFGSDTSLYFRQHILRPFLDQHLLEGAPKARLAPVTAFETGTNRWVELPAWPSGCASGCRVEPARLYLGAGLAAGFAAPKAADAPFDAYVSDPAKPAPYRPRPIAQHSEAAGEGWRTWLVADQREAAGRTDVLAFVSEPLTAPVRIAGAPRVNLVASTSGTDSDWVVKLIDVYPPEVAWKPHLGGYQLMVSGDIFRGRYRESYEVARPIATGKPLPYRFALPTANHVFLPGHRIMIQVQSSWFPLYDRNPQTFVPSLFDTKPGDYVKAEQRVWHAPGKESFVELPIVKEAP
ncbi:MAG: CocE/NonD family hydrolase [Anaeromyxobacter sp.]